MKTHLPLIVVTVAALLPGIAPAFAAPKAAPQTAATASAKKVDPLDIPAFAPIPNEFVFAGTQKDVYKLLERYTGGISLDKIPEPSPEELNAIKDKKDLEDYSTLQALLDVKHLLAPIHVVRVRSVSYYALAEAEQDKAYEGLGAKAEKPSDGSRAGDGTMAGGPAILGNMDRQNRGEERSRDLLANAETFYKKMLADQGGKVQMQLRGETSITVYAFSAPQTFAVVTRGPSRVIVARADGKPDVGAITGIFQKVIGNN